MAWAKVGKGGRKGRERKRGGRDQHKDPDRSRILRNRQGYSAAAWTTLGLVQGGSSHCPKGKGVGQARTLFCLRNFTISVCLSRRRQKTRK